MMWQIVHPDTYVVSGAITQNNWQWSVGEQKNEYTPLKPFTKDTRGTFWTAHDVKSTYTFNYYYPETPNGASASSVSNAVSSLYGPGSPSNKRDFRLGARSEGLPLVKGDRDYSCKIKTKKFAVGGSYYCNFYCGAPSLNSTIPGLNVTHPSLPGYNTTDNSNYAGMYAVLAPWDDMDEDTVVSGMVPLTTILQQKHTVGELPDLSEDTVTAFLSKSLNWQCFKRGGEEISPSQIDGFQVSVHSMEVLSSGGNGVLPTYGDEKSYPEVTQGKPGGSSGGSEGNDSQCSASIEYKYVDEAGNFLYKSMGEDN
jgi:tyrosinase